MGFSDRFAPLPVVICTWTPCFLSHHSYQVLCTFQLALMPANGQLPLPGSLLGFGRSYCLLCLSGSGLHYLNPEGLLLSSSSAAFPRPPPTPSPCPAAYPHSPFVASLVSHLHLALSMFQEMCLDSMLPIAITHSRACFCSPRFPLTPQTVVTVSSADSSHQRLRTWDVHAQFLLVLMLS